MSHVISSQPSSTSPYKPTQTEIAEESNGGKLSDIPPRIVTGETRNSRQDCCCYVNENDGCCLYALCRIFSRCFQGIGNCTEACCDSCANCLNDCCEDKPQDRNRRRYYYNNDDSYNNYNNDVASTENWLVGVTSDQDFDYGNIVNTDDRWTSHCRDGGNDGHTDTGCHSGGDTGGDTSGCCDSGGGGGGDTSGCCDSGGGGDTSGGFDSGGGCDPGGGGDSGGGCDSGGGDCCD